MTQSKRLLHISQQAKAIRIAYTKGEITHTERMQRLHGLVVGPNLCQRLKGWLNK